MNYKNVNGENGGRPSFADRFKGQHRHLPAESFDTDITVGSLQTSTYYTDRWAESDPEKR